MKNSKIFLWGFLIFVIVFCFAGMTEAKAQQAFSTMTVSQDGTTLTTKSRDLANGTNINTVDGPKYFNSYSNNWTVFIYNQDTNTRYQPWNRLGWNTNVSNLDESIGTWVASYTNSTTNSAPFFKDQNNAANTIPITATRNAPNGTINGVASSSNKEILKMEYILNNINSLPDNTRIFINWRPWFTAPDGTTRNSIADGIKKVGGQRTEPSTDPRWTPLNNQRPTLWLNNPANPRHNASLINNPTKDVFRITDGLFGDNIYNVKISSIGGTVVKELKDHIEGTNINIEYLSAGIYFVEVESEFGKFVKKLIKQ